MAANIEFVREENAYRKSWWRRGEGCIGSFDIKGWRDYGYLYMLNDFDEKYYAHVLLKQGEMLFRYETDATKISGMRPITKINIERGIIYFNEDLYSDDDKNLVFEKRGVKLVHLSLSDSVYKAYVNDSKYRLHKFEDGGEIKKYNSYEDFVNDNIGSKKYVLVYGSGGQSQPLDGATKDSIEKQFKGLIYHEFIDSEFYNNYASDDVKDEYKSLIKEFYNSLLESPKKFTSFWVNNMTKSTQSNSLYELKNKYKNIEENYNYSTGDKRLDSKSKYVLAIKNSVGQTIKYEPIEKPESYEFNIFSEFKNKMSNKLKQEYMDYRKKYSGEDIKFEDGGYMADGGEIKPEKPIEKMTKLELMRFVGKVNPTKHFYPKTTEAGRVQAKNIYNEYLSRKKMSKGGMVVTSIKDIPNFKQRLEERKITYRGLGMGKKSDDFYDLAGENGKIIKVDGKEYYITDTEFDSFSRGSDGKLRIRFDAPYKKSYADGGMMANGGYMAKGGEIELFNNEDLIKLLKSINFKTFNSSDISKINYSYYGTNTALYAKIYADPCIIIIKKSDDGMYNIYIGRESTSPTGLTFELTEYSFKINNLTFEDFEEGLKNAVRDNLVTLYSKYRSGSLQYIYFYGSEENAKKFALENGYIKIETTFDGQFPYYYINPSLEDYDSEKLLFVHRFSSDEVKEIGLSQLKNSSGMMANGGETKRVRKMYSDGGEVAMTILQQLGGTNRLNAMMGAYNFINIGNGVSFKIKNARANYIKITLTSMDLYDVEIGRIRGYEYKVVKKAEGLYFDQLKGFIESSTGMYMSFSEGGMINVKTEDGEVLKYKKDEDEMYVEVDERTKNYLTDIVLVLSRDFRKVGEKYIFWYDEMSDEDIEELENLFKTPFRIKKNKSRSDDFADGGVLSDSDYIIKDDESDRYFSMGLSDGKVKWNDSQDMAYMFNKREAESLKSKLELDGYSNLSVQKYNKDWWKMENGGDVKYSYGGRLDVGRYYKTKYGKQVRYLGKTKEPEVGAFSSKTDGVSNIRYDEIEGKASIFGNGGGIKEKYLFDVYKLDEYGSIIPSSKKRVSVIRVNLSSAKDSVYKKYPYKEYRIELFDKERV